MQIYPVANAHHHMMIFLYFIYMDRHTGADQHYVPPHPTSLVGTITDSLINISQKFVPRGHID